MRQVAFGIAGPAVVSLFLGCNQPSPVDATSSMGKASQVKNAVAVPPVYDARKDASGEVLGRVVLQPALDGKVLVVAVAPDPSAAVARVFILQSERPLGVTARDYPSAWVRYTRSAVLIETPTAGSAYLLRVNGSEPGSSSKARSRDRTVTLTGFGLAKRPGWFRLDAEGILPATIDEIVSSSCNTASLGSVGVQSFPPPCAAGGIGSSQCSITCGASSYGPASCETTCGDGYHACCNCNVGGASCLCQKNPRTAQAFPGTSTWLANRSTVPLWVRG